MAAGGEVWDGLSVVCNDLKWFRTPCVRALRLRCLLVLTGCVPSLIFDLVNLRGV